MRESDSGAPSRASGAVVSKQDDLDALDADALEDLDVDDDAEAVRGGTTFNCPTSH